MDARHDWPRGSYAPVLDGLIAGRAGGGDVRGRIVRAWYFVHYLLLGPLGEPPAPDYRDSFEKYLELSQGHETTGPAFVTAFGKTPAEMEAELYRYAGRGIATVTYPLQAYVGEISVRPLENYEIDLLWARIIAKKNIKEEARFLERAERELMEYLDSSPGDVDALAAMADVSRRMARGQRDQEVRRTRYVRAAEYGERAIGIDPTLVQTRHDVAVAYRVLGNKDESLRHLRHIHEQDPNDLDAVRWLAQMLAWEKRYQEALPFLEEMARREPANGMILELLEEARRHIAGVDVSAGDSSLDPGSAH
jgi:tetratricopeptide (TPR) repeat protein